MYSDKSEIVLGLFQQIEESILLLQQWNKDINEVDDYLLTPEEKPRGDIYKKQLPTIGMMIGSRYRIWIRTITG